jgi:hypothetical protein
MEDLEGAEFATVDDLIGGTLDREVFTFPDTGFKVEIRALSRYEAMTIHKLMRDKGIIDGEVRSIACAMVNPPMTEAQVRRWCQTTPAGALEPLTRRINQISGLGGEEVDRAIADEFRGAAGTGMGDDPSAAAAPHRSGTETLDEQR